MSNYWRRWIKAAGIRAVKTMAQTALAALAMSVTVTEVDWLNLAGTVALAGIISLLTSLVGLPELKDGYDDSKEME